MKLISEKIDVLKDELIKDTQEILRIRSLEEKAMPGKPFGEGVNEALLKALSIAEKLGFNTVNLDGYIGYAEYGQGEDYVAVLGHLDVVPEGDGWKYPPYAAEIHDNKIYARGAIDDKGPIMAALYGLKAIKDAEIPLSKRVRIIFGTNEETGCGEMEYYNSREKAPLFGFTPDAEFPIIYAEKGITIFDLVCPIKTASQRNMTIAYIKGGQRPNMVPDYCEAKVITDDPANVISYLSEFKFDREYNIKYEREEDGVVLKSYGVSAHGSTPELGKNAIMQLLEFLGTLPLEGSDIGDFIAFANKYIGLETDGRSFGIYMEDEASGKLSFNVGNISFSNEGEISLSLNVRYPVTFTLDELNSGLEMRLKNTQMQIRNFEHQGPLYYPKDNPLIEKLQKVYKEETGLEPELLAIGGGTYAKEMKNIVAFGPAFPGSPDLAHQANEYIDIEDLIKCAKIYGAAIYELSR